MFKEAKVERAEPHIEGEIAGDGGQVPCSEDVNPVVVNVESAGDAFKRSAAVARGETPADFNFVSQHRVAVVVSGVEDVRYLVDGVAGQGVEGGGNVGLCEELRDVEFRLIHPFIPDTVIWNINRTRYPLRASLLNGLLKVDGRFNHTQSHGSEEKGDEKRCLTGSAEHRLRWAS